jgi:hypothetical protein
MDLNKTYRRHHNLQADALAQLCFDLHTATLLIRVHRDGGVVDQAKQLVEGVTDKIRRMIPKAEAEDAAEQERDEVIGVLESLSVEELQAYLSERKKEAA